MKKCKLCNKPIEDKYVICLACSKKAKAAAAVRPKIERICARCKKHFVARDESHAICQVCYEYLLRHPEEPHFRFYVKSKHPALIVGEADKDTWQYRKVTHSKTDGINPTDKIMPNPNPADSEPMYVVRRVKEDNKKWFSKIYRWFWPKKK